MGYHSKKETNQITDVSLKNEASRQSIANVVGYYANEAGVSFHAKGGKSIGDSPLGFVVIADTNTIAIKIVND